MCVSNLLFFEGIRVDILLWVIAVVVIVLAAVVLWLQRRVHRKLRHELKLLEKLNKRNVEFETVLKTMKLATWKVDVPSHSVTLVSDFRENYNYAPAIDTDTSDIFRYLIPEDSQRATIKLQQMMAGELEECKMQYQVKLPSVDTVYWGESYVTVGKKDAQGLPQEIIGVSRRIDEQKRVETELVQALNKAEESDRLKSAFLANMSHEIRTPLNAIVGFSDVLPMVEDADERAHLVGLIQENNRKLLRMMDAIVNISKIEAGAEPPSMADFDLNVLLSEVAEHHRNENMNEQVKIETCCSDKVMFLHNDRSRISKILDEYITNALKFTESGVVTLGYNKLADKQLRIWVSDTGKGIPADRCEKIFEQFVKLDEHASGTGLGLFFCRSVAQSIGARVGMESEEGKGSKFWVEMPLGL